MTTAAATTPATSLKTSSPDLDAVQASPSLNEHVSGGSLGTRSFSLGSLIDELERIDNQIIWGINPTDPDELSDDPDDHGIEEDSPTDDGAVDDKYPQVTRLNLNE